MIEVSHGAVLFFRFPSSPGQSDLDHLAHARAERAPSISLRYTDIATSLSIGLADSVATLQALTAAPPNPEPAFRFLADRELVDIADFVRFQNAPNKDQNGSPLMQKDQGMI